MSKESDKKAMAAKRRANRRWEIYLLPFVRSYQKFVREDLKSNIKQARGKTPAKKVANWIDWEIAHAEGVKIYKPAMLRILEAGGTAAIRVKKDDVFDVVTPESTAWAAGHSADLVTNINDATMGGLRAIIVELLPPGSDLWSYQKLIRPMVGLTAPHVAAVSNFYTKLLDAGIDEDKALKMTIRKADKLHRFRAHMIARTETAFALGEGQLQGFEQMGFTSVQRVEDPDCCPICAEGQGKIYKITDAHGVIPAHPQCEGTWTPA